MAALTGLAVSNPETILATLAQRMRGFLPEDAIGLVTDYVDRTLRERSRAALLFAVLLTPGSAASQASVEP